MTERVRYEVLRKVGDAEIRKYGELQLATVYGIDDTESFGLLFDYISGKNRDGLKLPMTAPVVSSENPGLAEDETPSGRFFTFVLPQGFAAPVPSDPRIRIHVQPARTFAVLGFSGRDTATRARRMGEVLVETLGKHGISTRGGLFLMRYNSPFAPGFMRRNEVGIEISEQ